MGGARGFDPNPFNGSWLKSVLLGNRAKRTRPAIGRKRYLILTYYCLFENILVLSVVK
jgi:hypothetical protein